MKKYQSYNPSGIEWLETIPENWEKSKLKYLGNLYGGLTGKSGVDFNNDENPKNKPYIPYTNIFNNTYISKDHYHYVSIEEGENQNKVEKYDLFFLMSSETHKDLGKSCILIDDVDELYLNSFCKGYRVKNKNIHPLFLNYQILGHLHREMISVEGKGFTRINLRQDKINDLVVFYPSLQEQEQIVKYLDEKTSIIDKLISTKERKIELLKEQRTSLINQVITKGLDLNVKMKDSGVEWIGNIPVNWNLLKLKHEYKIQKGRIPKTINEKEEEGLVPYLSMEVLRGSETSSYVSNKDGIFVKEGQILILWDGSNSGEIIKVVKEGILSSTMGVLNKIGNKLNEDFSFYQLKSHEPEIRNNTNGMGIPHVDGQYVRSLVLLTPPLQEQEQIVKYLDKHTKEIEDLVYMEQNKIELLKEYRQSLISEVITGKIKVVE